MKKGSEMSGRTVQVAGAAVFGALAAILTTYLNFVYPLLGWLRFDFGEIPVMFAFLIFGPVAGFISAIVLWLILNFIGTFVPIGPVMKLIAVLATGAGLWLGIKLYGRVSRSPRFVGALTLGLALGLVVRVVLMTVANYALIVYITPAFFPGVDYIKIAKRWITFATPFEGLLIILGLTAVYNALHTLLSLVPTYSVGRIVHVLGAYRPAGEPWIIRATRK